RRSMLQGVAATAFAATSLTRAPHVLAADRPITPFGYRVRARALDDLKRRLEHTRWPEQETVADWSQGVPIKKMKALVEYWCTGYNWRRCETTLNGFAQYRAEIDGLNIHFLHVRSRQANHRHARLARLGDRVLQDHRAFDESCSPWRPCGGCLPRCRP